MPVLAGSRPETATYFGHESKFLVESTSGPVELGVPGQDICKVKPSAHHVPEGSPLPFQQTDSMLNHPSDLVRAVVGFMAVGGHSLEILQKQKGSASLAPAPAHGGALVHDRPDLILGQAAGHCLDNDPGKARPPGRLTLDKGEWAIGGKVAGPESLGAGSQDRRLNAQAPEEAFMHHGQVMFLQYPGNLTVGGFCGCTSLHTLGALHHQEDLPRPGARGIDKVNNSW